MIKLLFVTHQANFYGAPKCLLNILSRLNGKEADISVVCPSHVPDFIKALREIGLKIVLIRKFPHFKSSSIIIKLCFRICFVLKFLIYLNSRKPDIVYVNTILNSGVIFASWLFRIPVITHVHESIYSYQKFGCLRRYIVLKFSYLFILVSNVDKKAFLEAGIQSDRISVIYNTIDMDYYQKNVSAKNYNGYFDFTIGCFSTIEYHKGLHILVRAAKRLKNMYRIRYIILGDIPYGAKQDYLKNIKAEISAYRLQHNFIFEGFKKDIRPYLIFCDVVCVPSLREQFSLVALEAMSVGKPVILPRTAGVLEVITENRCVHFAPGDHKELANCIARLLEDDVLFKRLKLLGKEIVLNHFSLDAYVSKIWINIQKVYEEMRI